MYYTFYRLVLILSFSKTQWGLQAVPFKESIKVGNVSKAQLMRYLCHTEVGVHEIALGFQDGFLVNVG